MPILPITDGRGKLLRRANGMVRSIMLYPKSESDRAKLRTDDLARWFREGPTAPRWGGTIDEARANYQAEMERWGNYAIRDLFHLNPEKLTDAEVLERKDRGLLAGVVLLFLISIGEEVDTPSASVRNIANLGRRRHWGWPFGKKEIKGAYADFGSVKHLWAAAGLFIDKPLDFFEQWREPEYNTHALIALLSTAEYLRNRSRRHVKRSRREGSAPAKCTDWIPPSDLVLPDMSPFVTSGKLRPDIGALLKSKKA